LLCNSTGGAIYYEGGSIDVEGPGALVAAPLGGFPSTNTNPVTLCGVAFDPTNLTTWPGLTISGEAVFDAGGSPAGTAAVANAFPSAPNVGTSQLSASQPNLAASGVALDSHVQAITNNQLLAYGTVGASTGTAGAYTGFTVLTSAITGTLPASGSMTVNGVQQAYTATAADGTTTVAFASTTATQPSGPFTVGQAATQGQAAKIGTNAGDSPNAVTAQGNAATAASEATAAAASSSAAALAAEENNTILTFLNRLAANKLVKTTSGYSITVYADDGTTVLGTMTWTDDNAGNESRGAFTPA
jgi:hypothetical protein